MAKKVDEDIVIYVRPKFTRAHVFSQPRLARDHLRLCRQLLRHELHSCRHPCHLCRLLLRNYINFLLYACRQLLLRHALHSCRLLLRHELHSCRHLWHKKYRTQQQFLMNGLYTSHRTWHDYSVVLRLLKRLRISLGDKVNVATRAHTLSSKAFSASSSVSL